MEQRSWLLIQNFKQQYEILFLVPQGIIFKLYSKKKNRQNRQKNEDRYIWWANVRQVKILFMIRFFYVFVLIAILSEWSIFVLVDIPTNRQWTHPHARRWYRTLYEGLGEYTGFFFHHHPLTSVLSPSGSIITNTTTATTTKFITAIIITIAACVTFARLEDENKKKQMRKKTISETNGIFFHQNFCNRLPIFDIWWLRSVHLLYHSAFGGSITQCMAFVIFDRRKQTNMKQSQV